METRFLVHYSPNCQTQEHSNGKARKDPREPVKSSHHLRSLSFILSKHLVDKKGWKAWNRRFFNGVTLDTEVGNRPLEIEL